MSYTRDQVNEAVIDGEKAKHFVRMMALNVSNERLSDKEFREFISNSLPVVLEPPKSVDLSRGGYGISK